MRKRLILIFALTCLLGLIGCNHTETVDHGRPISAYIDEDVTSVDITHHVAGETTQWEAVGEEVDHLRDWATELQYKLIEFEEGQFPGDSNGGETYDFALTEGDYPGFSYIINGADNCYLLIEGYWYSVENPSNPPVEIHEGTETRWVRIPMVMVEGKLYYDTGKESTLDGRCGVMDGEITSTVDSSEIPTKDNQSNFSSANGYQYGTDGTIEVLIDGKWIVFEHRTGDGSQVKFGDKMVDADGLSEETLEWLDWYNSLSEKEQLSISSIPSDLYELCGYPKAEDVQAVESDTK